MAIYAMIGIAVVAAIFAAGAAWVVRTISFTPTKNPYDYKTDQYGNETVKDNTDAKA